MMWKKVSCILVAGSLLVGILSGCGNNSSSGETEEVEKKAEQKTEQVTLTILLSAGSEFGINDLIDEAMAEAYPEIELEWELINWNDLNTKMQTYIQSGLPDIIVGKATDAVTYGKMGILGDLAGKPYLQNINEVGTESVTVDGKVYGVAFDAMYQGIIYNRKVFEEHNVEIPTTYDELNAAISTFKDAGVTPFATHFVDTWSIGNLAMQFAMNEVFSKDAVWGDKFRNGDVTFVDSPEYRQAYENIKTIYDNTWKDETFSMEETACDAKFIEGEAAMKAPGFCPTDTFSSIDENFDYGVFPFPNTTGDAKLLFQSDITFMKNENTDETVSQAVDKVFTLLTEDKEMVGDICDITMKSPLVKDVETTYPDPSKSDIENYADKNEIVNVDIGNNQLQWGGFQDENAKAIAEWMQGNITLDAALQAADDRKDNSLQ